MTFMNELEKKIMAIKFKVAVTHLILADSVAHDDLSKSLVLISKPLHRQ